MIYYRNEKNSIIYIVYLFMPLLIQTLFNAIPKLKASI